VTSVSPSRRARRRALLAAAGAALAVAGLGALSTDIGPWYHGLAEPPWKPPDVLFGPVWTAIYALTAIAGVRAWECAPEGAARRALLALFAGNAFLNVLWSLLFFRMRRPDWAFFEVGLLWLSILLLVVVLVRHSRLSALLLVPYLAWVGFAGVLNLAVVRLNGPFG
jgi:tryptophan-rich sensory protein